MPYKNLSDKLANNKKWRENNPEKQQKIAKAANEKHYRNNKKSVQKRAKEWYDRNPKTYLWSAAKGRAKKAGLEFSITVDDFNFPETCPALGVPMIKGTETAPSLDRINSNKGYVKGNVQVISRKANLMKNNATAPELERFAKWVLKI